LGLMGRGGGIQGALALPGLENIGLSPIRRQYVELKRKRPDAILFFRLGDFYETFEDDARLVARVLDIALTSREMGRGERLPMAGIPAQAAGGYVARLIAQGHHVAIAEQVGEVPRNGLVRREIVRVITPGTVLEEDLLASKQNNFLAAVVREAGGCGLAYLDVSTGDFAATELRGLAAAEMLAAELTRVGPAECLAAEGDAAIGDEAPPGAHVTRRGPELFATQVALRNLTRHFGGAPEAIGLAEVPMAVRAAGGLLAYVQEARPSAVQTLQCPRLYAAGGAMLLDRATRHNLDLLESPGGSGLSLVGVLDRTGTPMGARLLRAWLGQPLLDMARINERLDAVERLVGDPPLRARLTGALRQLPDLERLAVRAGQQLLAPRECLALAAGLERLLGIVAALEKAMVPVLLEQARVALDPVSEAASDVRATLREDATVFEEGVIREGVSAELDQQRELAGDARRWIAALEQRERERTGVRAVKVGYNKVFGYYLEVSTAQCAQATDYYQRQATGAATVGEHLERCGWVRKQTLANAERFITPELKEMEARVARAHEEALKLERALYAALLERLAAVAPRVAQTARALALVDVAAALAEAAAAHDYTRPVVDEGDRIEIIGGRHPVVEQSLPAGSFVPNDTTLDSSARIMLLTGPNMAGKSTYLRQVALIVLMAQVGSFVPASSARIGVVDRVLTRIGAHDDIAAGRSTFMVEMIEAATILRSATDRSLVILDEVGRGTSTFDGMAIAQAIVEDLHNEQRRNGAPKTIFATHYHELTALAETLSGLRNYRVDVLERGDDVVFLHAVVEGGADRSYGIHVAGLAGVPEHVTRRARELLRDLESQRVPSNGAATHEAACAVCGDLADLDVLSLTPLQAQSELFRLQQRVRGTA
jgi:DNA mismatch repair protein MutS